MLSIQVKAAYTCGAAEIGKAAATIDIDTLVINNPNKSPYSINTSLNIYMTFQNLVSVLEHSAQGYLSALLQNSGGTGSSCGALEIGKAAATIDMELDLLRSGLYDVVRNEAMIYISNIVKSHLLDARVCDNQSYDLLVNTIKTIDTLVINNPNKSPYSINTSLNIYMTFQNLTSVLENSADSHLESLIYQLK